MKSLEAFNRIQPLLQYLREAPFYLGSRDYDNKVRIIGDFPRYYLVDTSPRIQQALRYRGLPHRIEEDFSGPLVICVGSLDQSALDFLCNPHDLDTPVGKSWWKQWKTHDVQRSSRGGIVFNGVEVEIIDQYPSRHTPMDEMSVDGNGDIFADLDVAHGLIKGYLSLKKAPDIVRAIVMAVHYGLVLRLEDYQVGSSNPKVLLALPDPIRALQITDQMGLYQQFFPGAVDFSWLKETLRPVLCIAPAALVALMYLNRPIPKQFQSKRVDRYQLLIQDYSMRLHSFSGPELWRHVVDEFGQEYRSALALLVCLNPSDKKKIMGYAPF